MTQRIDILKLLNIRHPIIQAPMVGVSTPELAAAVSNAGALGSIGLGGSTAEQARALIRKTRALTNATLPYARLLAREGVDGAFKTDAGLVPGLNTRGGEIAHPAVAEAHAEMKAA